MSTQEKKPSLIRSAERPPEQRGAHPLNPESEMHGVPLSDATGMSRIGVHVIRLRPGKESCVYHTHFGQEEFFYILSGRGKAEIDGCEHEVGPGDFMGFPTPSVAHHLWNPFDEELVYLVGGERAELEIADFPHLGKRLLRVGREGWVVDHDKLQPIGKPRG